MYDYSDVYIVVTVRLTVEGTNNANTRNKMLAFKINAPFGSDISKTNNTFIGSAADLDIATSILEYSCNHSMISGSLWNYYRDNVNEDPNENNSDNYSKTVTC